MKKSSEKAAQAWVLALTSVASFMVGLDALVVATALSTIRLHLGASIEALEWTVNAYTLSFAVLLMTGYPGYLGNPCLKMRSEQPFSIGLVNNFLMLYTSIIDFLQ